MVVYYILVIIPGIISLFYYLTKSDKTKTITFFLFFSFLWILLSLRSYEVGVDIVCYRIHTFASGTVIPALMFKDN